MGKRDLRNIAATFALVFTSLLGETRTYQSKKNINCSDYSNQLVQMADAQNKILKSMVKKNDSLAATLDDYADIFSSTRKVVKETDIVSLRSSAESFRHHTLRESKLVHEFNQKTMSLIEQINACLKDQSQNKDVKFNQQARVSRRSENNIKN